MTLTGPASVFAAPGYRQARTRRQALALLSGAAKLSKILRTPNGAISYDPRSGTGSHLRLQAAKSVRDVCVLCLEI